MATESGTQPQTRRTLAQIRHHYEVEKALARKLKATIDRQERIAIYRTMYDELFKSVPDHPRLRARQDPRSVNRFNARKLRLIKPFLNKASTIVEFGPGDCNFIMSLCDRVKFAFGVDLSDQGSSLKRRPANFELIVYDGYEVEIESSSVDVVFSDQLIEHLHPQDVDHHFKLIRSILKPGGVYVMRTPHRFTGPHDVSSYFSDHPEGFHLQEWTFTDIAKVLNRAQFLTWWGYWSPKGAFFKFPFEYFTLLESACAALPKRSKKLVAGLFLPSVIVAAVK
jgi:SAM-dependent methyltransferase